MSPKKHTHDKKHETPDEDSTPVKPDNSETQQEEAALEGVALPETAKDQESIQPASSPAPATASATSPKVQKRVMSSIPHLRDPGLEFNDDGEAMFPGYSDAAKAEMLRRVPCHCTESFGGTFKNARGAFDRFAFSKNDVVLLPKWFATQHPTRLVIKE